MLTNRLAERILRPMSGVVRSDLYERLVASWLEGQRSQSTRSAYGADLATFGRWCARQEAIPLRLTAQDVVAYHDACAADGDSPATVRRRASALSSFFDFAVAADAMRTNPSVGVPRPLVDAGAPSSTPSLAPEDVTEH